MWPSVDYQCSQWQICEELGVPYLSLGHMELAISCKQALPGFEQSKALFVCFPCLFCNAHSGWKVEGFLKVLGNNMSYSGLRGCCLHFNKPTHLSAQKNWAFSCTFLNKNFLPTQLESAEWWCKEISRRGLFKGMTILSVFPFFFYRIKNLKFCQQILFFP